MGGPNLFVSSRTMAEYMKMFGLDDSLLDGRILDVAGGAASFVASARARGIDAWAIDPIYGESTQRIADATIAGLLSSWRDINARVDRYNWGGYFEHPIDHAAERTESSSIFLRHLASSREAYLAKKLPDSGFGENQFDLVLSSHYLFTHANMLSPAEHVDAVFEMIRITRHEVRIYPVIGFYAEAAEHLRAVIDALSDAGVVFAFKPSGYHFVPGADEYLVIRKE